MARIGLLLVLRRDVVRARVGVIALLLLLLLQYLLYILLLLMMMVGDAVGVASSSES